jgi:ligand-binding sensor domain-containing protein
MCNVLFLSMPVIRMHNISRFGLVFLFLCLTGFLCAQELRYSFRNYTPSDGLPSSETYQALQDANHYMWFATDHGVTRYNGYEFEIFNLPDNSIMGLYEDWKKRIWVFTFSGRLFYYENGKFHNYKWNDQLVTTITPGVIHSIYVDSTDKVYISATGPFYVTATEKGVLNHEIKLSTVAKFEAFEIDDADFFLRTIAFPGRFHAPSLGSYDSLSELSITVNKKKIFIRLPQIIQHERCHIKKLSDDRLIMYTKDGYCLIRSSGDYEFINTPYTVEDIEEIDGKFFLATDKGLSVVNSKGETIEKYLNDIHITSIEKDYEGGLWLTTHTNGVYYLNHFKIRHLSVKHEIVNKRFNIVYRVADSSILAGTQGNELIRFKEFAYYQTKQLNLKNIVSFQQIRPEFVLVGGSVGWFGSRIWEEYKETNAIPKPLTYFQLYNNSNFLVRDSFLFSGTNLSIVEYKVGNLKKQYNDIKQAFRTAKLFLERDGTILVGNHFGLWRYIDGRLKPYDSTKKILNSRVTDIAYYQKKFLCLTTRGNGLLLLANDSIYQVKQENGLVSNNLRRIHVDDNNIWLASNNGISIIMVQSLQPFRYSVKNITVQDGLLSNEINSIIKSGRNVVIATNNGISFLDPVAVMAKQEPQLPLFIKEIKVDNEVVDWSMLMKLGYRKRSLNIRYEALNYSASGKNHYRYRLLGYDSNWVYTNTREIQFNQLPYGSYKVEIQAKREHDDWNGSVSFIQLPIVCKPPFWATTWFWITAFSIFTLFLILFFKNRINNLRLRQKQQEDLRQKINDTEQMALKAQMNPHFIFNSLNSIQQYVIESDVEGANKFISGFSKLIRQTLEFSSKELITLDEEVSYLSTYLELEKARMESAFIYNVNVKTKQPSSLLELPPLLLQPYVENALRHGIRYLKNVDGIISLSFIEQNGFLECIIQDNGIGRKRAMELKAENPIEYQSRGMSLTAERIALLNEGKEKKIKVTIEDLKDQQGNVAGTRIRVLFPV